MAIVLFYTGEPRYAKCYNMQMERLKFITLNTLYGGQLFDNMKAFLQNEQPDVLTLQEAYDGKEPDLPPNLRTIEELLKVFPGYHYYFSPQYRDIRKEGTALQGNAIFSRFPIIENKTVFFDIPYDDHYVEDEMNGDYTYDPHNLQHVTIQLPHTTANVINVHGIWGLDGADNPRRLQMSETIINTLKGKEHVIMAGDFNLKPNTQTIKNIESYVRNVFANELTSTFNMRHKTNPGYATAVVDMIFVSDNIRVIYKHMPDVDVSDHYPLVCELEI